MKIANLLGHTQSRHFFVYSECVLPELKQTFVIDKV